MSSSVVKAAENVTNNQNQPTDCTIHQVIHLVDDADREVFLHNLTFLSEKNPEGIKFYKKIVFYLNEKDLTLSSEDTLVMLLNLLHPTRNGADVTNPHALEHVWFVIEGDFLFTRYNYVLSSAIPTQDENEEIPALLRNALTPRAKKKIPFQVTSTEKAITKALLGLRGIKRVFFAEGPDVGRMESGFREALELSLVLNPAVIDPIPCASRSVRMALKPWATIDENRDPPENDDFDREGNFRSDAYNPSPSVNPYRTALSTRHIDENKGFTLYNMELMNPLDEEDSIDAISIHDLRLGWRVSAWEA